MKPPPFQNLVVDLVSSVPYFPPNQIVLKQSSDIHKYRNGGTWLSFL